MSEVRRVGENRQTQRMHCPTTARSGVQRSAAEPRGSLGFLARTGERRTFNSVKMAEGMRFELTVPFTSYNGLRDRPDRLNGAEATEYKIVFRTM